MTNCYKITFSCPSGRGDCTFSANTCDLLTTIEGTVAAGVTYTEETCLAEETIFFSSGTYTIEHCKETYSAGTFVSYICQECTSGSTQVSTIATNTPHPSYTNSFGDEVIQTQMITLGGPNGLNS